MTQNQKCAAGPSDPNLPPPNPHSDGAQRARGGDSDGDGDGDGDAECRCHRLAKLAQDLRESDRRWQGHLACLEDTFQTSQRKLQRRIADLEQEVSLLRRGADLGASVQGGSGDGFASALLYLSQRVNSLDKILASTFASEAGAPRRAPGFRRFASLPPELRDAVWTSAMPRRVHGVRGDFRGWSAKHGPPALARACLESRRVARRTGRMTAFHEVFDAGEWNQYTGEPAGRNRDASWFDVRHDVLHVHATGDWEPDRVGDACQAVENVLLSCEEDGTLITCLPYLFHPAYFSNLRVVQLEMPGSRFLLGGQTTTVGEEEIFGQSLDASFYIDVDDEELVQRIADRLRSRPAFRPTSDGWLGNIRAARSGWHAWVDSIRLGPPAEGWAGFKCWLEHYWLSSLQKNTPLTEKVIISSSGARRQIVWDHPWVQSVKKQMPLIQRVGMVKRCCGTI